MPLLGLKLHRQNAKPGAAVLTSEWQEEAARCANASAHIAKMAIAFLVLP